MYPEFVNFCRDAMEFLGFNMTWMQEDIAEFMQYGPDKSMVSAQRGEAKSTIACIFGIWCLIQDPRCRVFLISGAEDKAGENGALMFRLITRWPMLDYLSPDKAAGDKTSLLEFDVHWSLKGIDKSASVKCAGITGAIQGYRADVLIPDDIETTKNGLTHTQRAHLELLSKEFSAICTKGRILYLGTPQTKDSIYNNLPARGYEVRIWPGRFPTSAEITRYGPYLAPSILERITLLGAKCQTGCGLDGSRGWSADPQRYTEAELVEKELDNGPEYYQLQYMLDTSLADAMRQQLKLRDLIVGEFDFRNAPEVVGWAAEPKFRMHLGAEFPVQKAELYRPAFISDGFAPVKQMTMYIDPAGDGGDEFAFSIGGVVGPFIHAVAIGGLRGGFADDNLEKLVEYVKLFDVKHVLVEKNMGAGTVTKLVLNYFNGLDENGNKRITGVSVDERNVTGQKERRIIDTLRPVIQRHRLIIHQSAFDLDLELLKQYPLDKRSVRSVFLQMHSITTDRGCLEKDDRLDSLEGLVRELMNSLVIDEDAAARARTAAEAKQFIDDPMGYGTKNSRRRRVPKALRRRGL
jgi:hypothetical protein